MKNQLDVTCYFISIIMRSTCFGHQYIHLQEPATVDELLHRSSCCVKMDVLAISVPLQCVVVCLCDVFCRLVVIVRCILIDFDRFILCFCDH